jgi:hypothetical protein
VTPDQIKSHSVAELAVLYPDIPVPELRKMRKRATSAIWQRNYRSVGRDSSNAYLGSFDGPAIAHCPVYSKMVEDAIAGSQKLLRALQNTGARP